MTAFRQRPGLKTLTIVNCTARGIIYDCSSVPIPLNLVLTLARSLNYARKGALQTEAHLYDGKSRLREHNNVNSAGHWTQ